MKANSDKPKKEATIWSLPFVILMVVNFFQSMAAFMTNTTLPLYASELGAGTALAGMTVSSFAVMALLVRPFAGPAFDSFSRKKLLLAAQGIICASLMLYGVVTSLPLLVATRMLHGIGIGCSGPLAMSLVSEFLPPSKFASGISIYTLAQSFAQVVGPAAGLYMIDAFGFSPSYFSAGALLMVAMCGIFLIREPSRELLPYRFKLNRMFAKEALPAACALMLISMSFSCMAIYVVLYGNEVGVEGLGAFFTVYACCLVITRPVFGKLADRIGAPRMLFVGIVCFAASYVALSVARDMPGFILAAVIGSAGFGVCAPLLQSTALASVDPDRRGAASNTAFTGLDTGMLVGPIAGGFVVELLVPLLGTKVAAFSSMWIVMLIPAMGCMAIVVFWNIKLSRQRRSEAHAEPKRPPE